MNNAFDSSGNVLKTIENDRHDGNDEKHEEDHITPGEEENREVVNDVEDDTENVDLLQEEEKEEEKKNEVLEINENIPLATTPAMWLTMLTIFVTEMYHKYVNHKDCKENVESEEWNSTMLLDEIHERLLNRFGLTMDGLISVAMLKFSVGQKLFQTELTSQELKFMLQTNVVWLRTQPKRSISISQDTPKSLMQFMILFQYTQGEMLRNHSARRLNPEETSLSLIESFEKHFKQLLQQQPSRPIPGLLFNINETTNAAGLVALFFNFYVFLMLHEMKYQSNKGKEASEDVHCISLWKSHLNVMMLWLKRLKGESFSCFPVRLLSQQLMPLVYNQALDWNFIKNSRSTLSLLKFVNPAQHQQQQSKLKFEISKITSVSVGNNRIKANHDEIAEENELQESSQSEQEEDDVDNFEEDEDERTANASSRSKNDYFAPSNEIRMRGKNVVYQFERIPPKR
jgi:hypothetical protein